MPGSSADSFTLFIMTSGTILKSATAARSVLRRASEQRAKPLWAPTGAPIAVKVTACVTNGGRDTFLPGQMKWAVISQCHHIGQGISDTMDACAAWEGARSAGTRGRKRFSTLQEMLLLRRNVPLTPGAITGTQGACRLRRSRPRLSKLRHSITCGRRSPQCRLMRRQRLKRKLRHLECPTTTTDRRALPQWSALA